MVVHGKGKRGEKGAILSGGGSAVVLGFQPPTAAYLLVAGRLVQRDAVARVTLINAVWCRRYTGSGS
jgi:hypothetical protein